MYEVFLKVAPQVPALVVLVMLVFKFLKFLEAYRDSLVPIIERATDVIEDNSKIQGQVLEALHRTNGHTRLEPVQHIEADKGSEVTNAR